MRLVWESLPGDLPDGFGIGRSGRIYLANAGLGAQIVVIAPDGREVERFPETPLTGENGSGMPFDVAVGERGQPVFVPRTAGRPR